MSTEDAISRVIQWCRENAPGALVNLQPGATDDAIADAASRTAVEWPEGMYALFRAINGEVRNKAQLIPYFGLLSLDEVVDDWKMLQDIRARAREDSGAGDGDDDFGYPLVPDEDESSEERFMRLVQSAEADDQEPQSTPVNWSASFDRVETEVHESVGESGEDTGQPDDNSNGTGEIVGGAEIWVNSADSDWGVYGTAGTADDAAFDQELEDFRFSLDGSPIADYGPFHPEIPEGQAGSMTPNWIEAEFVPFASWDGDILAVDLRPGQHHGCVIQWEPVDRSQGMEWSSLEAFFVELLASLESGGPFMRSRRRVSAKGNLKWRMDD